MRRNFHDSPLAPFRVGCDKAGTLVVWGRMPIDGLSGDQRFFLSYAQSWRHKSTDDSIRQQLVSNSHAPVKYRVDGVVRNMDAWYNAFNVKPSDKLFLAPENRARIW